MAKKKIPMNIRNFFLILFNKKLFKNELNAYPIDKLPIITPIISS